MHPKTFTPTGCCAYLSKNKTKHVHFDFKYVFFGPCNAILEWFNCGNIQKVKMAVEFFFNNSDGAPKDLSSNTGR